MSADLLASFDKLAHPRVLVLGDFIVDRYTWGNAERVSQEAPVILLRADTREARLGGAGNVCAMLHGLEAQVTAAGVVGDDADGRTLRDLLVQAHADTSCVMLDPSRPTTVKERFIGRAQGRHPHQILRVDNEVRDALRPELEKRLGDRLLDMLSQHDIVLVSDYDKGVCTPRLLRLVIDHCRSSGIPVLVDPIRSTDYTRYRGATSMTPNRTEAGMATGISIETSDDALRAGRKLCRELKLDLAIVTLDRDGMALVMPDGRGEVFPTKPRAVYDITGAGDMVLSMIGVALASGLEPAEAIRLGNIAGGLEVEKVGVAVIPRTEICARLLSDRSSTQGKLVGLDQLSNFAQTHRAMGQKIVMAGGCFDLLHVGHVRHLEEAARLGDVLVVALNSDASARRLKGAGRPVIGQRDRAAMLAALACVGYVTVFDDATPIELVKRVRPDVLVKGGNYRRDQVVGHEFVASYGGEVCVTPMIDGISTSGIVSAVQKAA
ncbi:MAG TPA: D-glycero-beta-D-manno-heptose 1-phosphate adenylyltransferase [Pirellulales bacterium]|nr:D-glycero-beta-D-manno-heptose 1-phosphate adenylyltransferase [Pirellulales bacterium]